MTSRIPRVTNSPGLGAALLLTSGFLVLAACGPPRQSPSGKNRSLEAVERGRYLTNAVADCFDCHSPLLETTPPVPVPHLLGSGDVLDDATGLVAPNITPDLATGAGLWTDLQLERAIRGGIGHDGRALSQEMPWNFYSALSDEDVASIVAYLRSLSPVSHELAKSRAPRAEVLDVPPVAPFDPANLADPSRRGGYLVRLARCVNCHTPLVDDTRLDMARAFSGGRRFRLRSFWYVTVEPDPRLAGRDSPDAAGGETIASANLTPHVSGIPHYDVEMFRKTLRTGKVNGVRPLSGAMPWVAFQHMTDEDLAGIYAYLRSLPPMAHNVSNVDPPTWCPVCRRRHGLGDRNERYATGP